MVQQAIRNYFTILAVILENKHVEISSSFIGFSIYDLRKLNDTPSAPPILIVMKSVEIETSRRMGRKEQNGKGKDVSRGTEWDW